MPCEKSEQSELGHAAAVQQQQHQCLQHPARPDWLGDGRLAVTPKMYFWRVLVRHRCLEVLAAGVV